MTYYLLQNGPHKMESHGSFEVSNPSTSNENGILSCIKSENLFVSRSIDIKEELIEEADCLGPKVEAENCLSSCPICSFKCVSSDELREHIENHGCDKQFKKISCAGCVVSGIKFCKVHGVEAQYLLTMYDTPSPKRSYHRVKKLLGDSSLKPKKKPTKKVFVCDVCPFKTGSIFKLKTHANSHKALFTCCNCSYSTLNICDFEEHLRSHAVEKPFNCDFCLFQTPWKRDLEYHVKQHSQPPALIYTCAECDFETYEEHLHTLHINVHDTERANLILQCNHCAFQGVRKFFKPHMRIHKKLFQTRRKSVYVKHETCRIEQYVFKCCYCHFATTKRLLFKMHMQAHKKQCCVCFYQTAEICIFIAHMTEHIDAPKLTCNVCSYQAASKVFLLAHMMIHAVGDRFTCKFCSLKLKMKSHLNTHLNVCTFRKEKRVHKFKCVLCNYSMNKKSLLLKHLKIHRTRKVITSKTPFICRKCQFSTTLKYNYKQHMVFHKIKRYLCDYCSYECKSYRDFKIHRQLHTFKCQSCNKGFAKHNQLNVHMRMHVAS